MPKAKELPTVYCAECCYFIRDTSGRSYCHETGEYFLGVCNLGLKPDTVIKQFANRPRHCKNYVKK